MSEPSFPRVVLVDAPSFDANIRFDLNSTFGSATCVTNSDGFSLGAPTLDVEPGASGGSYGYRSVTLTPRIEGPKAAALSLLSALARELLRPENWLLIQLDALTEPVWFHLYQSQPAPLSLDEVYVDDYRRDDAWQTSLSLTADAFALGERITLDPLTFTQSPTGLSATLPAIRGDAPTELRVSVSPTDHSSFNSRWVVGCFPSSAPVVDIGIGDGLTAVSGTGAGAAGAGYFNGSYRPVTVDASAAGSASAVRLAGLLGPFSPGRFRLWLRVEVDPPSSGSLTYSFCYSRHLGGLSGAPASVTVIAGFGAAKKAWMDLGDVSTVGVNVPADSPFESATIPAYLSSWVNAGTGTARLDAFKLIPIADEGSTSFEVVNPPSCNGEASTDHYDGDYSWGTSPSGDPVISSEIIKGGFPTANPSTVNTLAVFAAQDGDSSINGATTPPTTMGLNSAAAVTVSYQPKFLHLPGDPDA